MTNNANLKRAARSFMEKHEGVPYLAALKAVDEPLHELRDLMEHKRLINFNYHPHFRLTADDRRTPAYAESVTQSLPAAETYGQVIIKNTLSHFATLESFLIEYGTRSATLQSSGAADIWSYRELYRAGLLDQGFRQMEPFFHYFGGELSPQLDLAFRNGPGLGIFCVSIGEDSYRGFRSFIPVTEGDLETLKFGGARKRLAELTPLPEERIFEAARWFVRSSSTKALRPILLPVAQELVAEGRGTILDLINALKSDRNEHRQQLGHEMEIGLEGYQQRVTDFALLDGLSQSIKRGIDELNELGTNGEPYITEVPDAPQGFTSWEEISEM